MFKIPDKEKKMIEKLEAAGYKAFIIGGWVRDTLIGVPAKDVDIFTNASGEEILKTFPSGKVLGGEDRQAKILTVIVDDVEISQFRSNGDRTKTGTSLEEHQSTCDFTINSIAAKLNGKKVTLIDPHNGIGDIGQKIIRTCGSPTQRIKEDKLRVLRALRFKIKYGFKIAPPLARIIKKTTLQDIPMERVRDELFKMVVYPIAMKTLDQFGFLSELNPDWDKLKALEGGHYHAENNGDHCFWAHQHCTKHSNNPLLCLATFLHDIGKERASNIEEDGLLHFYQHENHGVDIARPMLEKLKLSNNDIAYILFMIKNHMFGYMETIKDNAYAKFFGKLEAASIPVEDYILLIYCDNQANMAKPRIKFLEFLKGNPMYKKYIELLSKNTPFGIKDLNISGKDLIELGMNPGKNMGDFLKKIFEEVQWGRIKNEKMDLLFFARENLKNEG